jgi:hypothetical protein
MILFNEATRALTSLKIPLSQYSWFKCLGVEPDLDGFCVVVYVGHIDNKVRKIIPPVYNGVSIKIEVAS